ncbi:hypothetical protein MPLDJ20_20434 [Mesorhizobium plurifarium]|uniref:Uncharacterized protein n=1 Tax=Mesorhizobium plurifarium TaxID=69974 RepID=A0A090EX65_MESPL|nr:hypothetical protein MPLDJ20_20434 [Mesorhizobium plurifarium]
MPRRRGISDADREQDIFGDGSLLRPHDLTRPPGPDLAQRQNPARPSQLDASDVGIASKPQPVPATKMGA